VEITKINIAISTRNVLRIKPPRLHYIDQIGTVTI
jgi:hypothetical protein